MVTRIQEVDSTVIQEIVDRIVASVDPRKIILFGSHAYGKPHVDSDVDILVIMESSLPRYKRAVPIYNALAGLLVPKDVVVYTPEEIEAWVDVPQAFITSVMDKGKILYEKQQS